MHIMIHSLQKNSCGFNYLKELFVSMQHGGPILGVSMKQKFQYEKDGRVVESHARPANIWSFNFWLDMASYQS